MSRGHGIDFIEQVSRPLRSVPEKEERRANGCTSAGRFHNYASASFHLSGGFDNDSVLRSSCCK